jgi:hypothetical protein
LHYIAGNPRDVARTAAFKLAVSLSGYDFSAPARSIRNAGAVAASVLILLGGLWGAARLHAGGAFGTPAGRLTAAAAVATVCATLVMLLIGPVGLRYRISFTGFLYLWAGILAATLSERAVRANPSPPLVFDVASR